MKKIKTLKTTAKQSRPLSSPQSIKITRQEQIAKGIIWFLAVMTIAILVWIIGYLMVKGLWYDNSVPYNVTNQVETQISLPAGPGTINEDVVFIIHHKTRSKDITVEALRKLYNKTRAENWGFYNQQDLKVVPFAYEGAGDFSRGARNFILKGEELESYRKTVKKVGSWEEMVQRVSATPGALGFIPASMAENLPRKVKVLGVRRRSVAVNPSVLEIQDGRMLRDISSENQLALLAGKIANWKEVGGTDLPVVLIRWSSGEVNESEPVVSNSKARVINAASEGEFIQLIQDTRGAVA
ncbi:MAG: hypothetical protein PF479_20670, partial [Oceanispirochaeta sp.]|nr:hypothetical protein [Oceanispirochaeta sp.]